MFQMAAGFMNVIFSSSSSSSSSSSPPSSLSSSPYPSLSLLWSSSAIARRGRPSTQQKQLCKEEFAGCHSLSRGNGASLVARGLEARADQSLGLCSKSNDPSGQLGAFCTLCNMMKTVCECEGSKECEVCLFVGWLVA